MKIQVSGRAKRDLASGFHFYEKQSPGIGPYFLNSLLAEIDSLRLYAGTHPAKNGLHRMVSRRFPYGIYYRVEGDFVSVRAVLDDRRRPSRTGARLERE